MRLRAPRREMYCDGERGEPYGCTRMSCDRRASVGTATVRHCAPALRRRGGDAVLASVLRTPNRRAAAHARGGSPSGAESRRRFVAPLHRASSRRQLRTRSRSVSACCAAPARNMPPTSIAPSRAEEFGTRAIRSTSCNARCSARSSAAAIGATSRSRTNSKRSSRSARNGRGQQTDPESSQRSNARRPRSVRV